MPSVFSTLVNSANSVNVRLKITAYGRHCIDLTCHRTTRSDIILIPLLMAVVLCLLITTKTRCAIGTSSRSSELLIPHFKIWRCKACCDWQSSACLTPSDFAVWQWCCKSFCTPAFAI